MILVKFLFDVETGNILHCERSVRIKNFSGPYFPIFGLNVNQKNSEYGDFLLSISTHKPYKLTI